MSSQNTCHECGAPVPAESPSGLCGKCILGLALSQTAPATKNPLTSDPRNEGPAQEGHSGTGGLERRLVNVVADEIPGYRLLEEIGHGGCGVVYLAEQERPVRRRVALKVIKIGMDTKQVVSRFDAERQVLARMDHPNIAKVLDAGATTRGRPYFAMELVGGLKITEYCDQNCLRTVERLELFIQVCRAIQHAHQKGIIHRDIKPSNVLVAQHDGVAIPKVIDFGIAKATQGKLIDQTVFTAFEQFLGTPVYMSPEQAQPGGLDVDTRSDIYSLGVLLYELLTGKTPFEFETPNPSRLEIVRRTVLDKEPSRPSTRVNSMTQDQLKSVARSRRTDAPRLVKLLRGDLDWIVMKCLEKDRGRRYETANGLALDLQRHLAQEPVLARPPSTAYRMRKFVERNRLATFSAVAISASLIIGTTLSTYLAIKARRAEREQRRLRQEASTANQKATEELWASCLAQARAGRMSRQAGASFESLAAIARAAAIRPSLQLRNEAIAAMVQADIRWITGKQFGAHVRAMSETSGNYYALYEGSGKVSVKRILDDTQVALIPEVEASATGIWLLNASPPLIAVRYSDNQTRVWDWKNLTCLFQTRLEAIDFAADAKKMAISEPGRVSFFDLPVTASPPAQARQSVEIEAGIWGIRFSPDARFVAMYNELHTNILILEVGSGAITAKLQHDGGVRRIAWSPDSKYLVSSCEDNLIHFWEVGSGKEFSRLPAHQGLGVAFNPEGTLLAISGWDGRTRLLEFPNGKELVNIYKSGEMVGFGQDGSTLLEVSWDGHGLDLFKVANSRGLRTLHVHDSDARGPSGSAVFSHNGKILAFQSADGPRLYDTYAHREIEYGRDPQTALIGFDRNDQNLILSDERGILLLPLNSSHPLTPGEGQTLSPTIEPGARPVRSIQGIAGPGGSVSYDGDYCFVVGSNRCEIINTRTFTDPVLTGIHRGMRFSAATPDASLIATGAWLSPGVVVWDGRTGEPVKSFQTPDTTSVAFSPDGKLLVTATFDRYSFRQVGSWEEVLSIPQQAGNDFVPMMAFSRDGRIFAGTHSRDIVRLYDAATGEVLADLEPPDPHMVTGIAFNEDGSSLAVCEGYEATRIWDLQTIRSNLVPLGLDWKTKAPDLRQAMR